MIRKMAAFSHCSRSTVPRIWRGHWGGSGWTHHKTPHLPCHFFTPPPHHRQPLQRGHLCGKKRSVWLYLTIQTWLLVLVQLLAHWKLMAHLMNYCFQISFLHNFGGIILDMHRSEQWFFSFRPPDSCFGSHLFLLSFSVYCNSETWFYAWAS